VLISWSPLLNVFRFSDLNINPLTRAYARMPLIRACSLTQECVKRLVMGDRQVSLILFHKMITVSDCLLLLLMPYNRLSCISVHSLSCVLCAVSVCSTFGLLAYCFARMIAMDGSLLF